MSSSPTAQQDLHRPYLPFARSNALHSAKILHLSPPRTFGCFFQRPTLRQDSSPVAAKDLRLLLPEEIITRLPHAFDFSTDLNLPPLRTSCMTLPRLHQATPSQVKQVQARRHMTQLNSSSKPLHHEPHSLSKEFFKAEGIRDSPSRDKHK
jgi:hypothetical protein